MSQGNPCYETGCATSSSTSNERSVEFRSGLAADRPKRSNRLRSAIASLLAFGLFCSSPGLGFAADTTAHRADSFHPDASVAILLSDDPKALELDERSRIRAVSDRVRSSVTAWALRNNAVVLPRWIGPKPERKYKQSTLFEMHSEFADGERELAFRVSMKQKRFLQLELRF